MVLRLRASCTSANVHNHNSRRLHRAQSWVRAGLPLLQTNLAPWVQRVSDRCTLLFKRIGVEATVTTQALAPPSHPRRPALLNGWGHSQRQGNGLVPAGSKAMTARICCPARSWASTRRRHPADINRCGPAAAVSRAGRTTNSSSPRPQAYLLSVGWVIVYRALGTGLPHRYE